MRQEQNSAMKSQASISESGVLRGLVLSARTAPIIASGRPKK